MHTNRNSSRRLYTGFTSLGAVARASLMTIVLWVLVPVSMFANETAEAQMQETAVRKVGVAPFTAAPSTQVTAADTASISILFTKLLEERSYLQTKALDRRLKFNSSPSAFARVAIAEGVDGLIVGELSSEGITLKVVSGSSGRDLMTTVVSVDVISLDKSARRTIAEELVEKLLSEFPYRGFVTRVNVDGVDDAGIEINLGSEHGMKPGMRLQVFEFEGSPASFDSNKKFVADLVVTEVKGPDVSLAAPVGRGNRIERYAKIATSDKRIGTVDEFRTLSRGWILIGVEMVTVNADAASEKYSDRAYKMDSTPFFLLNMEIGKFTGGFKFGQARNDTVDLIYAEGLGYWKLGSRLLGPVALDFSVGARIANFNPTAKRNATSTLSATTSFSPAAMAEMAYAINNEWLLFVEGELFYPAFNTGGSMDGLLYTLGGGVTGGTRIDLKTNLALELGGRLKYFRKPIEGMSGVQERQTGAYAGLVVLF